MNGRKFNIAIAGATGAVGEKLLEVLSERDFPAGNIRLLASQRSAGKKLSFRERELTVEVLHPDSFQGTDIAFFSAGGGVSREYARYAVDSGAVVIDNSSAFRNDDNVPLIIPEINPEAAYSHRGIISNPNCTTAIMLTCLYPIHKYSAIKKIIVSSYQSVSGAGFKGINELKDQIRCLSRNEQPEASCFPHRIAYNVIPHIDSFKDNGYTGEEMKMFDETRKILGDQNIRVSATCVRVPVMSVHSMSVTVITSDEVSPAKAVELISSGSGVKVADDIGGLVYPMPVNCEGKSDCFVGRIRKDTAFDNGLSLWICGDQLLKGAALNAVQIAELIIGKAT